VSEDAEILTLRLWAYLGIVRKLLADLPSSEAGELLAAVEAYRGVLRGVLVGRGDCNATPL
jgi:hypothetical protein